MDSSPLFEGIMDLREHFQVDTSSGPPETVGNFEHMQFLGEGSKETIEGNFQLRTYARNELADRYSIDAFIYLGDSGRL